MPQHLDCGDVLGFTGIYRLKKILIIVLLLVVTGSAQAASKLTISISGADTSLKDNIALTLGTVYREDVQSYFFSRRIAKAITDSARALGYYHAEFDYQHTDKQLSITITPGPVVVWGESRVVVSNHDDPLPAIKRLIEQAPFVPGKPINHAVYDDYKQQLMDLCLQLGYQSASFKRHELRINTQSNRASAYIAIDAGKRYTIAAIEYAGSELTRNVLDSLAVVSEGDWYSRALVAQQYKSLLDTGFFSSVEIKPLFDHDHGRVTLQVALQQVADNRYLLGGGFGTDTGPRVTFRWLKPVVNPAGHSFYSDIEVARDIQQMTVRYQVPVGHPLNRFIEWGSGIQSKQIEDTDSQRITTGLNLHTSKNQWQRVVGVNIESEKYQQGDEASQQTTYVLPTASWSYTTLSANADRGYRFWVNLQASTEELYSDTRFFRVVSGAKSLWPLTEKHSIISRLEVGALINNDFDEVPSSKRFFTGGDQTVRGYNFESLAPRNSDGDLIGGDRLTVASMEYRWRFKPQWAVAAFIDTGRAYSDSSDPFRTGAGIGGRWFSPIGQVSVDIGFPINDDEYDGFQLHISMGPPI